MADHPCFTTLDRALGAYRAGRPKEALALAEAAWRMTEDIPGAPPHAAVVSAWYGYLVGTVGSRWRDGVELCRSATRIAFWEPRVYELLARLEIEGEMRHRALASVQRGLALSPDDPELLQLRRWLGLRRTPVIWFLDRSHPINRWLGRLRHRASNGDLSS
ncbi:MAG: hypothetical protein JSV80_12885 [Acidobacteriota bacterium]|nr:MAG: hypothetical protein JSV80_12885 [Acidobacteriota bacterium]